LATFTRNQQQLQHTIDSFEAVQISTEELKAALQKQTDTFSHVAAAIQLGLENQTRMGISVQNMEGKLNGCALYPVTRSHKTLTKTDEFSTGGA
jgi:hypothetical protein